MNMKAKNLFIGMVIGSILTHSIAFAKNGKEWIEVIYSNIKIYVDGVQVEPKDANGTTVEPFIYNGTTYLPVRAVGQAIGKQVHWDGLTQSVWIGKMPGEENNLLELCPPYDGTKYKIYESAEGEYVAIAGQKYTDAIVFNDGYSTTPATALFNLNAQYDKLSFEIGRVDASTQKDATLNIYLDGKRYKSYELAAEGLPQKISINLNKALQMKIEVIRNGSGGGRQYGIINAVIE